MQKWQLQQAKARLSELVHSAQIQGPQEITLRGKSAAVLVSRADFDRLQGHKPGFVDLLRNSPLRDVVVDLERDRCRIPATDFLPRFPPTNGSWSSGNTRAPPN